MITFFKWKTLINPPAQDAITLLNNAMSKDLTTPMRQPQFDTVSSEDEDDDSDSEDEEEVTVMEGHLFTSPAENIFIWQFPSQLVIYCRRHVTIQYNIQFNVDGEPTQIRVCSRSAGLTENELAAIRARYTSDVWPQMFAAVKSDETRGYDVTLSRACSGVNQVRKLTDTYLIITCPTSKSGSFANQEWF